MNIKKLSFNILIASTVILSGCAGKTANSTSADSNKNNSAVTTNSNSAATANTNTSSNSAASVKTNFEPIKPNTVPQLSTEKKKQIDSKMNSALKNLDNALKSLQDPSDINYDSAN